jgi:hypothetical protein
LGSSGDDDKERSFRVTSVLAEDNFLDLGAEGESLGDQIVFSTKLKRGGKQVGHAGIVCTIVSLEREEVQCVATFWFRGGQITGQALVGGVPTFVSPITGGSGKYSGAEGEIQIRQVSQTKEILTFHLED